jgi:mono/diheme cytochrome c family protein
MAMAAAAALLASTPARAADPETLARGEYLASIMDCGGCHTPGSLVGKPDTERRLAGGDIGFGIPGLGVFLPPNLTGDEATGLGGWSVAEVAAAIREGRRPDGRMLAPAMPWRAYAALSDADAEALATYLKSLPGIANQVPGPFGPEETPSAPYLSVVMPE